MECNAEYGDFVKIHTEKEIYEGIYLPGPEAQVVLLKLISGYNIGFDKKNIVKIEFVKKKKNFDNNFELVSDGNKPTIGLVILGGTISSRLNPGKGGVDFVETPEDLFKYYPRLFEKVNVKVEVPFMKGSENMDFKDWQKVAKVISKLLSDEGISGVVVTQGTDTLHYTSSALSFFLRNLNKPVVLTYSQRSIDRASSDADLNLKCSVIAATSPVCEVMTVGHATTNDDFCYAILGTKVRKLHSSKRDAFKPVNCGPLMKIWDDEKNNKLKTEENINFEILSKYTLRDDKKKVILDASFEEKVALLKFYPGQNPNILDYYMKEGYKGIIIEMTGLGQIAVSGARLSWISKLREVQKKGLIVCATSQTIYGRVNPMVYVTGRELEKLGVIYLEDMLSETAFTKLGWVLGHKDWAKDKEVVREKMLFNFAREFNKRLSK